MKEYEISMSFTIGFLLRIFIFAITIVIFTRYTVENQASDSLKPDVASSSIWERNVIFNELFERSMIIIDTPNNRKWIELVNYCYDIINTNYEDSETSNRNHVSVVLIVNFVIAMLCQLFTYLNFCDAHQILFQLCKTLTTSNILVSDNAINDQKRQQIGIKLINITYWLNPFIAALALNPIQSFPTLLIQLLLYSKHL